MKNPEIDEDPFKLNEGVIIWTILNAEENSPIWPAFKFVLDFNACAGFQQV